MPRDLAGHKLQAAAWTLVIEQDPAGRMQVVGLPVVDGDEVPVDLRHPVRRAGIERRQLGLRDLLHLAEHLARRRLIEPRLRTHLADRLEHPRHPDPRELGRQRRLDPRHRHKRHRRQVVDLRRVRCPQRVRPASADRAGRPDAASPDHEYARCDRTARSRTAAPSRGPHSPYRAATRPNTSRPAP